MVHRGGRHYRYSKALALIIAASTNPDPAYWTTYGTRFISNDWAFRLPFLIQIFPSLVLGVAAIFLPQSPRWLATKGRDEEALAVLSKLRKLPPADERVMAEYYDVVADAIFHRDVLAKTHNVSADRTVDLPVLTELSAFFDLFRANCRKRTAVGVALVFLQQFVGINACEWARRLPNP